MPKRIVDGEGIWLSDRIAKLPEQFRAEYANILPLAMADGVFECEPRRVWCTVYAYNRPNVTVEQVTEMLDAMEKAGLIHRAEHDGRTWAFFIGIDKTGRLPEPSKRSRYLSGLHPDNLRTMFGHLLQGANGSENGNAKKLRFTPEEAKRLMLSKTAKTKGK